MFKIKFTRKQREGLADTFINIGQASAIAAIAGVFVEDKVTLINGFVLGLIAVIFIAIGVLLRGGKGGGEKS